MMFAQSAYVLNVDKFTEKTYSKIVMTQAELIISKFGGIAPMARILGHKNASTVQGWRERGTIPPRQHQAIWEAAKANGISLDLSEFAAVETAA